MSFLDEIIKSRRNFSLFKEPQNQGSAGILFPRSCGICGKVLYSMADVRAHLDEHLRQEMPRVLEVIEEMRRRAVYHRIIKKE